jgi:hypothetical protein
MNGEAQVWKFEVEPDEFELAMPRGARVLSVGMQRERVQMWALVDPSAPVEQRRFRMAGTGHPIKDPEELRFVGTFQVHGGALVFHLFERDSAKAGV